MTRKQLRCMPQTREWLSHCSEPKQPFVDIYSMTDTRLTLLGTHAWNYVTSACCCMLYVTLFCVMYKSLFCFVIYIILYNIRSVLYWQSECTNQNRQDCVQVPAGSHGTLGCDAAGSSWHECRNTSSRARWSSSQAAPLVVLNCRI